MQRKWLLFARADSAIDDYTTSSVTLASLPITSIRMHRAEISHARNDDNTAIFPQAPLERASKSESVLKGQPPLKSWERTLT